MITIPSIRNNEPRYRGHPLSAWLKAISPRNEQALEPGCTFESAPDAIAHMGTNSLPYLVEWLSYDCERTPIRDSVNWAIEKCPALARIDGLEAWAWFDTKDVRGEAAYLAFQFLGETASSTIPNLVQVAIKPGEIVPRYRAVAALGYIGPNALSALLCIVTNETVESMVRFSAAERIGSFGTNASSAIPTLLRTLREGDTIVTAGVAKALGAMRLEPREVVPVLAGAALKPGGMHRPFAMSALGNFGADARLAIPFLRQILDCDDWYLQVHASNALFRIDSGDPANRLFH